MTITRTEAEHIAAGWAHRQSIRRGYACTPRVDELAHGYAVWMQLPPQVRTEPGEDVTTVIDRETGRLSHWPPAPIPELDRRYTERRDDAVGSHQTSDPVAELRREAHRRVSPSVAAHLTLGGRLLRARGAKGDQVLRHHPLVAARLAAIPPTHTVRGAERHAELLVVSDALYETDKSRAADGQDPLTLDEARGLLRQGGFETFHIRESGDPLGGRPARFCATCSDVLAELSVIEPDDRTHRHDRQLTSGDDPQPGRFPPEVAWELAAENWDAAGQLKRSRFAARAVESVASVRGAEFALERFPAADAAYAEFYDVAPYRVSPGVAHRVRWFEIGVGEMRHLADPLHEFGELIGARVFPLGVESFDEAILVIDEGGRVFALDQGGEWFLGAGLDEALTALVTGLPAARLRDDGNWLDERNPR